MQTRPPLSELGLNTGKKTRLRRILFDYGLRNGTALFLPYDQGLEHGPRDLFANPEASDPGYIVKLAIAGEFNGIAIQIGLAEKFFWDYAGEIPLILKLNGKTVLITGELIRGTGAVGVIGPTRMHYPRAINAVDSLSRMISKVVNPRS